MDTSLVDRTGECAGRELANAEDWGWTSFRVSRRREITVVKLLGVAMVHQSDILEFDRELGALIEAGHLRLVLNFDRVGRLSSQVLGTVLKAHRRCAADGGLLKLCAIQPPVAEIISLTGLGGRIEIYPEERPAVESDWPPPPRHRPTPAATPSTPEDERDIADRAMSPLEMSGPPYDGGLRRGGEDSSPGASPPDPELLPSCGRENPGRPLQAGVRDDGSGGDAIAIDFADAPPARAADPSAHGPQAALHIRLIVRTGRAQGRAVAIREPRLFIGRDPCCQIRAESGLVSGIHAIIERRGGRVFVRDLGTVNGTWLDDRQLLGEEAEAADGNRLLIGPLEFSFAIGPDPMCPTASVAPSCGHPLEGPEAPSSPSILCPRCGAEGWVSFDRLLRELVFAIGHAAPPLATVGRPSLGDSSPPMAVPGLPTREPPVAIAPPSPRPPSPDPRPAAQTQAVPPVNDSLERVVQDALEALQEPDAEPGDAPPEEPEPASHSTRSLVDRLHLCCPQCGIEGGARVDQLERQLSCKKCGARFYLNTKGDLVVGDLPRGRLERDDLRPSISSPYNRWKSDPRGRHAKRWDRIARPIGIALVAALAFLAIGLTHWVTTGPTLPATLQGRATYVAEAFAHESRGRLRAVAAPGMVRDVDAWMNLVRPHFWDGTNRDVRVAVTVQHQDTKKAVVVAHVIVPAGPGRPDPRPAATSSGRAALKESPIAANDRREIELRLFWVRDSRGWWLDGSQTFKSAVRSRFWVASR